MAQIPKCQRSGLMGAGGQSRHVVHLGALVVHVRQQQRRHVPVEGRCKFITLDEPKLDVGAEHRSEEHTSELQSLMRISYAVFCLKKKTYPDTARQTTYRKRHNSNQPGAKNKRQTQSHP